MNCPSCSAQNVQRVPLVHEQGTTVVNATTKTVGGVFGSGVGAAVSQTSGVSQTALAAKAAPPQPASYARGFVLIALGLVFALGVFNNEMPVGARALSVVMFAAPLLYFGYRSYQKAENYNRTTHRDLRSEWEASWYCYSCGHVFVV